LRLRRPRVAIALAEAQVGYDAGAWRHADGGARPADRDLGEG